MRRKPGRRKEERKSDEEEVREEQQVRRVPVILLLMKLPGWILTSFITSHCYSSDVRLPFLILIQQQNSYNDTFTQRFGKRFTLLTSLSLVK